MAHSNKALITIDNIDWTNRDAKERAYLHFRNQKIGYKMDLEAVTDEVEQCMTLYKGKFTSEALGHCKKVLIKFEAAHQIHLKCVQDILHIHKIRELHIYIDM